MNPFQKILENVKNEYAIEFDTELLPKFSEAIRESEIRGKGILSADKSEERIQLALDFAKNTYVSSRFSDYCIYFENTQFPFNHAFSKEKAAEKAMESIILAFSNAKSNQITD